MLADDQARPIDDAIGEKPSVLVERRQTAVAGRRTRIDLERWVAGPGSVIPIRTPDA